MNWERFLYDIFVNAIPSLIIISGFYFLLQRNDNRDILFIQQEIDFAYRVIFDFMEKYKNAIKHWNEYFWSAKQNTIELEKFIDSCDDAIRILSMLNVTNFKMDEEYEDVLKYIDLLKDESLKDIKSVEDLKKRSKEFKRLNEEVISKTKSLKLKINRKSYKV